jgi:heptosyltransferase-2
MKCMEEISAEEVFEAVKNRIPRGRAVFFDRDGTLCEDANFLKSWDKFKVFPDIDKLDLLKKGGFSLIGVSNQSGIARGIVDEGFAKEVNEVFVNRYGFDAFYHCPHHPEEHCSCRKPEPGMPLRARQELSVDLKSSFVVGDKEADMLLAKSVGARAVLVLTGEARETADADFTAKNLTEAVRWILENGYNK